MGVGRWIRTATLIRAATGLALGAIALLVPAQVDAQDDFLFGQPLLTLSVYGGWSMPAEGSDLFSETSRELTIQDGDFASALGMAEAAFRVTDRIDVALSLSHAGRSVQSEMAEWEWADGRPIVQATRFSRTRLLASGKYYLMPRGREISRYAWIPHRWTPYVGGGAGVSWYDYSQEGDFAVQRGTDPNDRDILELSLESSDSGLTALALAGVQMTLSPRFLVRAEYRYLWGSGDLDPVTFEGFEPIDLSGSNVLVGISMRI